MYTGGLLHKPFFIAHILHRVLIIRPTKKMVAIYIVGDLAIID